MTQVQQVSRWHHLVAVIALTLLWALFFWRILTPNPIDRVIFTEGDFTQHYFAFADYQVERLWQGQFPLWNPYNHAGDPFAGNIQFVAFYPPRLLAAFIAGADGWTLEAYQLEVALHYWLASVMMYAFLIVFTKRSGVAFIGSLLYAYSGYLTGYPLLQVSVLESVIWLPLMMLGIQLSLERHRWRIHGMLLAGIACALSLLGGHPQTTLQITYFTLAYFVFMAWKQRLIFSEIVLRIAVMGIVGGGLSAIQLLPALEFTRLSFRVTDYGYLDKANGFLPVDLFQVILPNLFGVWSPLYLGTAGLLLAIGAMTRPKLSITRPFWMLTIALGAFLSLGGGSIVYDLFYLLVPGINIFRQQERIANVMIFALVMLACEFLSESNARQDIRTRYALYAYTGLLLLIAAIASIQPEKDLLHNTLSFVALNTLLFAVWYTWEHTYTGARWHVYVPLAALIVTDLFTIGTRLENYVPDVPENRVQLDAPLQNLPVTDTLEWRIDGAAGLQGYSVYFRQPDIYGTGPFTLASIENLRTIPVERFWEVLSVRYVTTTDEPPSDVPLELIAYGEQAPYKLFELQDPRPIAHLVYDYRSAEGNADFARQIMSDPRVNLREMAITLDPLPFELPVERPSISHVNSITWTMPEHAEISISTATNALLTLSIPNYPGWQASVNGEPVAIVDTYAGLIGIPLLAGENQAITLTFAPQSVHYGLLISAATGALTLALALLFRHGHLRQQ